MIALVKNLLLGIILLVSTQTAFAQNIGGTITDSLGKAVPFASVTLKNNNVILAYTVTNNKGEYSIAIPANAPKTGLLVEVSCVGYKKQNLVLTDASVPCNFKLSASSKQLNEVMIKNSRPHLKVSGDTLSYRASDFSSPQDRVIGDVIKKLPGVTVAADGKISYNNKPISNLYIGGDNLLDDKYNIATGAIPNKVVDLVQILENHQPIKALKGKVVSDDVAMNLTFKPDAKIKVVGQETVGAGLPGKYDENLNAMMFKDKYKAINYLKGNNTGYDVQNDLVSHNMASYLSRLDNDKPNTVLSLGTAGDPDLPRNRYLFDQSGIINLNNLVNLKKDVQLKANVSYLHDTQTQNYTKSTQIYQPNDTVKYTETQQNKRRPDWIHTQFTLNINRDKYYLNNTLVTDYSHNTNYSGLTTNGVFANQVFKDNTLDFSNEFNLINTTKSNKIYEWYSYINRITEPETRTIEPGLTSSKLNNNVPYASLLQTTNIPTWFTNNYLSFKIPGNYLTQSYKAGFSQQAQQLQSSLNAVQYNNTVTPALKNSTNNLDWNRTRIYADAQYDVPGNKLKLTVDLPLNLQLLNYNDAQYNLDKTLNRLYFNPKVSGKYQTGVENYVSFGYGFKNDVGNIQDVYYGNILKNYRSLYSNNADLTERQTQTALLGFNYRKAITLFFFGANAMYTHSVANNISSSIITDTLQQRIVLPFENGFDSWQLSTSISKYNFALRTTFSTGINWQSSRSNQIQNGIILPYNTIATTLNAGIESKISEKVNLSYKAYYTQTTSESKVLSSKAVIKQLQQQGAINYIPSSNLFLSLSGDHYFTHQDAANDLKYIFADASARYKFNKIKTDLELSAVNLFDTRTYSALYLSANTFTANTYTIPGRFFLLKAMFNI
ncbi:carboxypeptidase-like protein [Mucilaginibacter gracilis]|uniref:Carboxypeptidase-like protein n=1 Tax=Mucilaginibacter gracilis TaxID=423350 RepID=A0A495J859_9SPHI|nr:carboxypeptidase-like regulatory domain-containing protein [Mucilaginibacter gracilis]RKR85067.1 carboxypeptidase-like protein [Mucilaginibacter gracilis]